MGRESSHHMTKRDWTMKIHQYGLLISISLVLMACSDEKPITGGNPDLSSNDGISQEQGVSSSSWISSGMELSSEQSLSSGENGSSTTGLSSNINGSSVAFSSSAVSMSSVVGPLDPDWVEPVCTSTGGTISPEDPCILYFGRWDRTTYPATPTASWSGAYVRMRFQGTGVSVKIASDGSDYLYRIDGGAMTLLSQDGTPFTAQLATGLPSGAHEVEVFRRSEGSFGMFSFQGFEVEGGGVIPPNAPKQRKIECMGNSITAGFSADAPGNTRATNSTITAWCVQTAMKVGAEWSVVAHSGQGMYQNLYGSGQTEYGHIITMFDEYQWTHFPTWSAAPGLPWDYNGAGNRIQWGFSNRPDAVIFAIGTNDYITDGPDKIVFDAAYKAKYNQFLDMVRQKYPKQSTAIFLHGIILPDEWSPHGKWDRNNRLLESIVAERNAAGDERIFLINPRPNFSNEGMWLEDNAIDYNGDRTHPSILGHQKLSDKVSAIVKAKMGWN